MVLVVSHTGIVADGDFVIVIDIEVWPDVVSDVGMRSAVAEVVHEVRL